jgi:hypothetical protein
MREHARSDEASRDFAFHAAFVIETQKVMPVFKMVDTCAGEFESSTPYYYGTFEQEDDVRTFEGRNKGTISSPALAMDSAP